MRLRSVFAESRIFCFDASANLEFVIGRRGFHGVAGLAGVRCVVLLNLRRLTREFFDDALLGGGCVDRELFSYAVSLTPTIVSAMAIGWIAQWKDATGVGVHPLAGWAPYLE